MSLSREQIEGWKMNNGSMSPNEFRALCDLALVAIPSSTGAHGDSEALPVLVPKALHPSTKALVVEFANALALKLRRAEEKYGYDDGWSGSAWEEECRERLYEHLQKGDPRDVAAYCAFMHFHGWNTAQPSSIEPWTTHGQIEFVCRMLDDDGQHMLSGRLQEYKRHVINQPIQGSTTRSAIGPWIPNHEWPRLCADVTGAEAIRWKVGDVEGYRWMKIIPPDGGGAAK